MGRGAPLADRSLEEEGRACKPSLDIKCLLPLRLCSAAPASLLAADLFACKAHHEFGSPVPHHELVLQLQTTKYSDAAIL